MSQNSSLSEIKKKELRDNFDRHLCKDQWDDSQNDLDLKSQIELEREEEERMEKK